jgi:hypothetical protein
MVKRGIAQNDEPFPVRNPFFGRICTGTFRKIGASRTLGIFEFFANSAPVLVPPLEG